MSPSQKTNLFNSEKSAWIILLCVLGGWSYFSFTNWIGDSEFWPITLSGHLDQWKTQPALLMKPLFHLSLSWIYLFDLNSVEHLKIAKAFYAALGCLCFVFNYFLLKREIEWQKALLVVFIFLFSHLGFTQIGLIRSDFLSYFFVLIFFLLIPKVPTYSWLKFGFINFIFTALLYLISPKSLFFSVLIFIYSLFQLQKGSKFRFALLYGWLCTLSFFTIDQLILDGAAAAAFTNAVEFVARSHYALNTLPFFNIYIKNFIISDALIWFMIFAGLAWQFYVNRKISLLKWPVIGVVTIILIAFHRPVLPFFVGSYWGILFLCLIPFYKRISIKLISIFFGVLLVVFFYRFSFIYYYPNEIQLKAVGVIDKSIKEIPNGKIFDGLGVAPRVPNYLFYLGPDEPYSNLHIWQSIQEKKPELIVYTVRLGLIKDQIKPFLLEHYKPVGVGYWLRNDLVLPTKDLELLKPAFFIFGYYPVPEILKN